jgi:hypothetical protein
MDGQQPYVKPVPSGLAAACHLGGQQPASLVGQVGPGPATRELLLCWSLALSVCLNGSLLVYLQCYSLVVSCLSAEIQTYETIHSDLTLE